MPLTELTKITGPGIKTTTNLEVNHGNFTGIVTATKFVGDISEATGASAGLGTALSQTQTSPLNSIYYVNDTLFVTEQVLIQVPNTSSNAYTQYANVEVGDGLNLTIDDDVTFTADVLSLFN
tara:strand:- start:61 stop:426 length:366 start_codon:yes stop_codon:yes gene_type:complete